MVDLLVVWISLAHDERELFLIDLRKRPIEEFQKLLSRLGYAHDGRHDHDLVPQMVGAGILRQELKVLVFAMPRVCARILSLKLWQDTHWHWLVNELVNQLPDKRCPLGRAGLITPAMKSVDLSEELIWKCPNPRP